LKDNAEQDLLKAKKIMVLLFENDIVNPNLSNSIIINLFDNEWLEFERLFLTSLRILANLKNLN